MTPGRGPTCWSCRRGGGKPTNLTAHLLNAGFPSFSRDGQWIYFKIVQSQEGRIWKIPAAGGNAVQVTGNAGTVAIESHDGRDLYYVSAADRPGSLWRLPLAGGDPIKLLDGIVLGNFDVVEGGIYYIDRVSGEAGVHLTDLPSGETRLQYLRVCDWPVHDRGVQTRGGQLRHERFP